MGLQSETLDDVYDPEWNNPKSELTAYQEFEEAQDVEYLPSDRSTHPIKETSKRRDHELNNVNDNVDEQEINNLYQDVEKESSTSDSDSDDATASENPGLQDHNLNDALSLKE